MNNSLHQMLHQWYRLKDEQEWVLGTIYRTAGSSYRKAGAMMMYSSKGLQLGLLSGGCLEADIKRNAKKVLALKKPELLRYDGSDEDDISYQLGIGCGGVVEIILQPISTSNAYLQLDKVHESLLSKTPVLYEQFISNNESLNNAYSELKDQTFNKQHSGFKDARSALVNTTEQLWLKSHFYPRPHLLVCGGSYDARPLVDTASKLGWEVTVWDPRPANARLEHFASATTILNQQNAELAHYAIDQNVNAVVMMTHNVSLDAYALNQLVNSHFSYIGLLGPQHRKEQVIEHAGLTQSNKVKKLRGPIGIEIGARLPESIAVSVVSEIHRFLYLDCTELDLCSLADAKA